MTDRMYLPPYALGQPGSINIGGGGGSIGGAEALRFRDPLDAARAQMGQRIPSAEYPDGYLGTIRSRREDRLLRALQSRVNDRSYVRGVHKGERIDPGDYYWPAEFTPLDGMRRAARAVPVPGQGWLVERAAPLQTWQEQMMVSEGRSLPRGAVGLLPPDQQLNTSLRRFAPSWS